jgi:tetratricopeptide (TPR) repeat protein
MYNSFILTATAQTQLLVGREKEIKQLFDNINSSKRSVTLLSGESGIGKSRLLDEFYNILIFPENDHQHLLVSSSSFFVGYYDKAKALIAESQSLIYPFNIALANFIQNAKESQKSQEKIDITINRLKKAFRKFIEEEGEEMAKAIIQDAANKAGLENSFKVAKRFWNKFKDQKTSITLAEDFVAKNSQDILQSYLDIFQSLAEEFKERQFVLIFDQFESAGKAAIDFFLNFVKLMPPDRFHIVIAFRTEERRWSEFTTRKLYEDTKDGIINELGGKELRLEGLSPEEIGKWIKIARGINLQLIPDLKRVWENSAGLPLLLNEWINNSPNLNYEEIKRDRLCEQILKQKKDLTDEDKDRLYRISILLYPIKDQMLSEYLQINNGNSDADILTIPFIERLIERGIFDKKYEWFRHELIKKCFEDDLREERKKRYHNRAADFYLKLFEEQRQLREKEDEDNYDNNSNANKLTKRSYQIAIECANHLHNAGRHEESYTYNERLADYASKTIGDLDLAERCYKIAIDDAEKLGNLAGKVHSIHKLSVYVYKVWGRYDEALDNYQYVLKYYEDIKARSNQSGALNDIANIYIMKGEYDAALDKYNESFEIKRELGDKNGIAMSLGNIANIHYSIGEFDAALDKYNESLEIKRELGDKNGIAGLLNNIGLIYEINREYDAALDKHNESLDIRRHLGDKIGIAMSLSNVGGIYDHKGEFDAALDKYNESLEIKRELGDKNGIAMSLNNIGLLYAHKGEYDAALDKFNESLEIRRQLGDKYGIATSLNNVGGVLIRRGKYEEALPHLLRAYTITQRLPSPLGVVNLTSIKNVLGEEKYQKLVSNANQQ